MEKRTKVDPYLICSILQVAVASVLILASYLVFIKDDGGGGGGDDDVSLYYANTGVITILTENPGDVKIPVFYGDSFFRTDSTVHDIRLANFALGLELSCFHYPEGERGDPYDPGVIPEKVSPVNLEAFLKDIGFEDFAVNPDFEAEPLIDNIGVGIASKRIGDCTVLAVVINGVHYTAQFGGNFKVGESGTHEGFQLGADKVIGFIRQYISEQSIGGKVKMLLTGYSRGAAISNISSAMIDDAMAEGNVTDLLGDVSLSPDDLYGFGFMTPRTVPDDSPVSPDDPRYNNIYSYIDPNDLVNMVPPALYKFTHYGRVIEMPSNDMALVPSWKNYVTNYFGEEVFETYDRSTYSPHEELKDKTEGEVMQTFLNRFVNAVTDGERQVYYDEVQTDLSWGMYILYSHTSMVPDIADQVMNDFMNIIIAAVSGEERLTEQLHATLGPVFTEYGLEEKDGDAVIGELIIVVFGILKAQGGPDILTDPYFYTIWTNGTYMLMPHLPHNLCGWMYYLDGNYPEAGIGSRCRPPGPPCPVPAGYTVPPVRGTS